MKKGCLFVIGTPIGNLGDITQRAIEVLAQVEVLVCEDTRVTGSLMSHLRDRGKLENNPKYIAYGDHNAYDKWEEVVDLVKVGKKVGLISDAGMPMISDPGYRVVRGCYDRELEVEVIPGVSSVSTSLVMAGLGGNNFLFVGFLPKKQGKRKKEIEKIKKSFLIYEDLRVIFYLSPYRIAKELRILRKVLGEGFKGVILREMTKKFEERIEGEIGKLVEQVEKKEIKGELVLVLTRKTD